MPYNCLPYIQDPRARPCVTEMTSHPWIKYWVDKIMIGGGKGNMPYSAHASTTPSLDPQGKWDASMLDPRKVNNADSELNQRVVCDSPVDRPPAGWITNPFNTETVPPGSHIFDRRPAAPVPQRALGHCHTDLPIPDPDLDLNPGGGDNIDHAAELDRLVVCDSPINPTQPRQSTNLFSMTCYPDAVAFNQQLDLLCDSSAAAVASDPHPPVPCASFSRPAVSTAAPRFSPSAIRAPIKVVGSMRPTATGESDAARGQLACDMISPRTGRAAMSSSSFRSQRHLKAHNNPISSIANQSNGTTPGRVPRSVHYLTRQLVGQGVRGLSRLVWICDSIGDVDATAGILALSHGMH